MWKPAQLLNEDVVLSLRQNGMGELEIEFLGWLNGNASAVNNSKNPVKAAHTLLAKPSNEKMFEVFAAKKKESVRPKQREEHDATSQKFRKLEKWIEQVNEDVEAAREPQWEQ